MEGDPNRVPRHLPPSGPPDPTYRPRPVHDPGSPDPSGRRSRDPVTPHIPASVLLRTPTQTRSTLGTLPARGLVPDAHPVRVSRAGVSRCDRTQIQYRLTPGGFLCSRTSDTCTTINLFPRNVYVNLIPRTLVTLIVHPGFWLLFIERFSVSFPLSFLVPFYLHLYPPSVLPADFGGLRLSPSSLGDLPRTTTAVNLNPEPRRPDTFLCETTDFGVQCD